MLLHTGRVALHCAHVLFAQLITVMVAALLVAALTLIQAGGLTTVVLVAWIAGNGNSDDVVFEHRVSVIAVQLQLMGCCVLAL